MNIEQKTQKAIQRLEKEKHSVTPVKSEYLDLNMSQSIDRKGKNVSIITYFGGGHGLLVDGKEYHMEIMFYELRPNTTIEKNVQQLGMEIFDYGVGEITEEEETED